MNLLLAAVLLAPAYAEVDCVSGRYNGLRYRFDDPIAFKVRLSHNPDHLSYFYANGFSTMGRCLYA